MNTRGEFIPNGCWSCGSPPETGHTPRCEATTSSDKIVHEAKEDAKTEREGTIEEVTQYTDQAIDEVMEYLEQVFAYEHVEQNFRFHNPEHTRGVISRLERILDTMQAGGVQLSHAERDLGRIMAAYHDTIQGWEVNQDWPEGSEDATYGKKMRKRFTKQNERLSGDMAVRAMEDANEQAGKRIFTEEDSARVRSGIDGTVPGFDPELGTVIQPNAEASSDVLVIALALADLGEAGMESPDVYLTGGDNLFIEENMDMWDLDIEDLDDEQKAYYQGRMTGWNNFQPIFADGRRKKLDDEIASLPEGAQTLVRNLFSHFDETITEARERAERRADMTFEELYEEMGFLKGDIAGSVEANRAYDEALSEAKAAASKVRLDQAAK